jgi:hypothetical protein
VSCGIHSTRDAAEVPPRPAAEQVVHAWNKFHATGRETGETALLRSLFGIFRRGDRALFDRYSAVWFMLALLPEWGVECMTLLHQISEANFSLGRRLGQGDHVDVSGCARTHRPGQLVTDLDMLIDDWPASLPQSP